MQNEDKIKAALLSALREPTSLYDCEGSIVNRLYAAIAPHLEASPDWAEAPEWAEWRTVDRHGAVLYWENEPIPDEENGFWVRRINDSEGDFEYGNLLLNWKETLQRRPE